MPIGLAALPFTTAASIWRVYSHVVMCCSNVIGLHDTAYNTTCKINLELVKFKH